MISQAPMCLAASMAARIGGAVHPVTPAKQILIMALTLGRRTARKGAGGVSGGAAAEEIGGAEQLGLLAQLAGQAGEADPAALHDVRLLGQAERDGGELLDQQHAGA